MSPKKSLGQHFLSDGRVARRIVEAAEIGPDDVILEVGPGKGALTKLLVQRAGRVVAVEVDEGLAERLSESLGDFNALEVVAADARDVDIDSLVAPDRPYKVVANLPYYAASPIIRRFLEADHKPVLMVVMVQREVAREMVAEPGKMRLLSVATQLYGRPRIVTTVPPRAFRPAPQVTSAVVHIDVFGELAVGIDSERRFFELVRAGFSTPRKQIHNSLRNGLDSTSDAVAVVLGKAGIDRTRRAQTLTLEEWGALYRSWRSLVDG